MMNDNFKLFPHFFAPYCKQTKNHKPRQKEALRQRCRRMQIESNANQDKISLYAGAMEVDQGRERCSVVIR